MAIQLNHLIVWTSDKRASAEFVAEILGVPAPAEFGPFLAVQTENDVTLDFLDLEYLDRPGEPIPQHYAFLVSDNEFDAIFGRITDQGLAYWADPFHKLPGVINTNDGGRGAYFEDPTGGLNLEIITRPYGEETRALA